MSRVTTYGPGDRITWGGITPAELDDAPDFEESAQFQEKVTDLLVSSCAPLNFANFNDAIGWAPEIIQKRWLDLLVAGKCEEYGQAHAEYARNFWKQEAIEKAHEHFKALRDDPDQKVFESELLGITA